MADVHKIIKQKQQLAVRMSVLFLCFYFLLPLSIALFPEMMIRPVPCFITWGWLLAFLQFIVTWLLAAIDVYKANKLDEQIKTVTEDRTPSP